MTSIDYTLKVNKHSITNKKLVCDVGINDACYQVRQLINGKYIIDPIYKKWASMLNRCYSPKVHSRQLTYKDCTVAPVWHSFMAFRSWMMSHDWENKHLDKDIIKPGNKVYSPETCCFVNHEINELLTDGMAARGVYPQGVSWHKASKKYRSVIKKHSKSIHIGLFSTVDKAEEAYWSEKIDYICQIAKQQEPRIRRGLILYCDRKLSELILRKETFNNT